MKGIRNKGFYNFQIQHIWISLAFFSLKLQCNNESDTVGATSKVGIESIYLKSGLRKKWLVVASFFSVSIWLLEEGF